jgi:hypothetical protein
MRSPHRHATQRSDFFKGGALLVKWTAAFSNYFAGNDPTGRITLTARREDETNGFAYSLFVNERTCRSASSPLSRNVGAMTMTVQ